jgi:hypothetical protein
LTVCKELQYLELKNLTGSDCTLSLSNFSTNTCFSPILRYLIIDLSTFDDCLYLLDGRLNQLSTFIVEIDDINASSLDIDNTVNQSYLKKIHYLICVFFYRRIFQISRHFR